LSGDTFNDDATLQNLQWYEAEDFLITHCSPLSYEVTQRHRFDSAPGHCRVTTLGKLFTHMCLCHQACIIWYQLHCWDVNRHTARYTGPVSVVSV